MTAFARHLSIAACATLAAGLAHGQTTLKMDGQWRGSLGAGVSVTSGNSKSTAVNINGELVRLTTQDKTRIYGTGLYGKNNGVEAANLLRAGGRYDYDLTPQVFGFGGIDFERDKIGNLKLRVAPSVGLGYHVIKSEPTTFDVFAGVGYVRDTFFTPVLLDGRTRDTYSRPELILGEESNHKLSDTTTFRQRLVVYPNLSNKGEFRSVFDAGLSVAMSKSLSLTVGVIDRYNSEPGPAFKKNDLLFVTGLAVKIE
jgi:putative salt-induced outer membrane protein YdiY